MFYSFNITLKGYRYQKR